MRSFISIAATLITSPLASCDFQIDEARDISDSLPDGGTPVFKVNYAGRSPAVQLEESYHVGNDADIFVAWDIELERSQSFLDSVDPPDPSDVSEDAASDSMEPTEITEKSPCTENWDCAAGEDCQDDGHCVTRDVLVYVITGTDGSPPPALMHNGEEVTLTFGREPWERMGVVPYSEWLPQAEFCESGLWIELRDPTDPSYGYGDGCVSDFKNLTVYLFEERLKYSVTPPPDPNGCPEVLYVATEELGCDQ